MLAPPGAPDWLEVATAEERPDLWEQAMASNLLSIWPEYNLHGSDTWRYFPAIFPAHAVLQVLFVDKRTERIIARGRTIGIRWDGSLRALPRGIDDAGLRALNESRPPTAVCALAAEIDNEVQGQGLSELLLRAMAMATVAAGLSRLIIPVRPSMKERYPLMPIARYAAWRRDDGQPFDSWLRVHTRLGARIVRPEAQSLRIGGTVQEWERWTEMSFPLDGSYVFPHGLAPLTVRRGRGSYWEPNVWVEHDISKVESPGRVTAPGAIGRPPAGGALGVQVRQVRRRLGRVTRRLGLQD